MNQTTNIMGTKPVMPLLLSMAFPPMLSMLIQSMYNIVDSIFVARLSRDALTAVSLVYPLQNLSLAAAVGLGVGLNACVARSLGENKKEKAQDAIAHGFFLTAIHSILFILTGLFLARPFLSLFTDDSRILDMAVTYASIVITLTFGSHFHIAIEKIFQATGNMVIPMVLQAIGAIISIGFFLSTPSLIYSGTFEALGKGVHSLAISVLRQMSILPILAWILPRFLGLTGVWIAFPIAEAAAAVYAYLLWRRLRIFLH